MSASSAARDCDRPSKRRASDGLQKTGSYHDTFVERVALDRKGIRPAFLPADAVRDILELKGFRHLFRHAYDLDLDPVRIATAAENASRTVARFDGWCKGFLAAVRDRYRDELGVALPGS